MKKTLISTFMAGIMGFVGVFAGILVLGDGQSDSEHDRRPSVNAALRTELTTLRKTVAGMEGQIKKLEEQVQLGAMNRSRLSASVSKSGSQIPAPVPIGQEGLEALAEKIRDLEEKVKTGSLVPTTVEEFQKKFDVAFAAKDGQSAIKAMVGISKLKDFTAFAEVWSQMREAKWLGLDRWERRGYGSAELYHWALTTSMLGLSEEATKEFQSSALWNLRRYEKDNSKVAETLAGYLQNQAAPVEKKASNNRRGRGQQETDPYRNALNQLAQVRDSSAIETLGTVLRNTQNPRDVRLTALRGLIRQRDPGAKSHVEGALKDGDGRIRGEAEIALKRATPAATGYLVTEVTPKLPAAMAGVAVGQIITAINGQPIKSARDIITIIRAASDGQTLTITVHDGSSSRNLSMTKTGRRIGVSGDSVKAQ
jgi:hypothetical protein